MSYTKLTTAAKLQSYFQGIVFSTSTQPTLAEVENWIDLATSVIYGALNTQYTVPITDTDDLKQLEPLADSYVLENIKTVLGLSPARQLSDGRLVPTTNIHKEFFSQLDLYSSGKIVLPNSSRNSTFVEAYSYNNDNDITPVARKEEVMW